MAKQKVQFAEDTWDVMCPEKVSDALLTVNEKIDRNLLMGEKN